jgi:release factor glutamine methyltransferase
MNAETLLTFVLGVNRAYLYAHPEHALSREDQTRYDEVIGQRSAGVPSQYITGHQEFWGLDFLVSPAVLIPRPETEHLVETVLRLTRDVRMPRIVDVGTGSGCIALALAHELKSAEVYAVDLSPDALEIARANAARLELEPRVSFLHGDVLTPVEESYGGVQLSKDAGGCGRPGRSFCFAGTTFRDLDFVVSNPPYVGWNEADKVQRAVFEFEPRMAVFAGSHGLDVIRPLIEQAHPALKPGGYLVMEIGYSMRDAVLDLLDPILWDEPSIVPDLQGIPRVVAARRR